jgi:hypothetical protein
MSKKRSQGEKKTKIRSVPTRPLHAVLDEPVQSRDCDWIIVLNQGGVLSFQEESVKQSCLWRTKKGK